MARDLANDQVNVIPPDSDYPRGRVKDKTIGIAGTKMKESLYGDMVQFFQKLMAEGGITPNHLPDSEYAGWQLWDAFLANLPVIPDPAAWATYIPTLSARNVSDAPVVGGFTALSKAFKWIRTRDSIVHIWGQLGGVATLATSSQLCFTMPFNLTAGQYFKGFALCNIYDGTNYFAGEVSVSFNSGGAGTEFMVKKLDGTAFGSTSGGTINFTITIEHGL